MFLKTKNYKLQLVKEVDVDFYLKLYQTSQLMTYIGSFNSELLIKSFNKSIQLNQSKTFKRLTFCIFHKNVRIGITSLIASKKNDSHCEIGTIIDTCFLNKCVAFEIMQKLIQYAFSQLNINCVYASFSGKNTAAHQLVIKLDFTVEPLENGDYYCYINKLKNIKVES